jgi:hypothetical protein
MLPAMATNPVRVLLSDGSGLTSRHAATLLACAGHEVESLVAESLPLTRLTRHVRRVHRVPAYGLDPWGWYEAVLGVLRRRRYHVRLVEPGNAFRAGVDLVDLMVRISLGAPVSRPAVPVEGVPPPTSSCWRCSGRPPAAVAAPCSARHARRSGDVPPIATATRS